MEELQGSIADTGCSPSSHSSGMPFLASADLPTPHTVHRCTHMHMCAGTGMHAWLPVCRVVWLHVTGVWVHAHMAVYMTASRSHIYTYGDLKCCLHMQSTQMHTARQACQGTWAAQVRRGRQHGSKGRRPVWGARVSSTFGREGLEELRLAGMRKTSECWTGEEAATREQIGDILVVTLRVKWSETHWNCHQ